MARRPRIEIEIVPRIATRKPRVQVPPDLRAALDELEDMKRMGLLNHGAWSARFTRALDAVRHIDDTEERVALLEPIFEFGALVGFFRE